MSKTVVFSSYGDPDVLHVIDVPVPAPGRGEIRVQVAAAGVQPFDALFRSGAARQWTPANFPQGIGNEFAGTVDAIGDGVSEVSPGDEVVGWNMLGSSAEHIVVPAFQVAPKPPGMPWLEAGSFPASAQTASTAMDALKLKAGETCLVHAAAGGVGTMAVQIAVAAGVRVIGTASDGNHAFLTSLGVTPVKYGPGLADRVNALVPGGIDAALIALGGEEALVASLSVVKDRSRIVTTAFDPAADRMGITRISTDRSRVRLKRLLDLYSAGKIRVSVQKSFPFAEAADAHRAIETGHIRGKVVLYPGESAGPAGA